MNGVGRRLKFCQQSTRACVEGGIKQERVSWFSAPTFDVIVVDGPQDTNKHRDLFVNFILNFDLIKIKKTSKLANNWKFEFD